MAIIETEKFKNNLEKTIIYKTEEDLNIDEIKLMLNKLNDLYKTENTTKLKSLNYDLNEKFKKINQIDNDYITVFDKTIKKYKETAEATVKNFNKLNNNKDME